MVTTEPVWPTRPRYLQSGPRHKTSAGLCSGSRRQGRRRTQGQSQGAVRTEAHPAKRPDSGLGLCLNQGPATPALQALSVPDIPHLEATKPGTQTWPGHEARRKRLEDVMLPTTQSRTHRNSGKDARVPLQGGDTPGHPTLCKKEPE